MTTYVLRNPNLPDPEAQQIQVFVPAGQTLSLVWSAAGWNIAGTTDELPTETPRGFGPFVTAYAAKTQYRTTDQVLLPNGAIAKPKAALTTGMSFDPAQWTVINDVGAAVDTGGLVTNNDSRLTDARTPKPASVTPSTIQSGGLPQTVIAGLTAALQNLSDGKASHADLDAAITSLIAGAPGILDTFAEVASKFSDNDSALAAVTTLANQMMKAVDAAATFVPMTSSAAALSDAQKLQAQTNMGALGRSANLGDVASKPAARATLGLAEYNVDSYGGGPSKTQAQNDAAVAAALADMNASASKMGVLQFPSPGAYTLSPGIVLAAGQGIVGPYRDTAQLMFTSSTVGTCIAARRPNYTSGSGSKTGGLFRGVTIDMTGMPAGSVGMDIGDLGNTEITGCTIRDNYDTNFRVDGNGKRSIGLLARNVTGWSERWNAELFVSKCGTQVVFDGGTTSGQSIRQSFDYGTFLLRIQVPPNCDGIEFRNGPIFLGDRVEVTGNSTPATAATVAAQGLTPNADGTLTNTGRMLVIGGANDSPVVRATSWHWSVESQGPGWNHTTIDLAAGADFQAVGVMNFASNGALYREGNKLGKFRFLGHLHVDPKYGLMAAGQSSRVVGLHGSSLGSSSATTFFGDTGNTFLRQLTAGSNTFELGGDTFAQFVNIYGSSGTYTIKLNPTAAQATSVTLATLNLPATEADIRAALNAAAAPVGTGDSATVGNVAVSTNISSTPAQLKFTAKGLAAGMKISITGTGDFQSVVQPSGWFNQVIDADFIIQQPDSGKGTVDSWPASWKWVSNGGQPPTLVGPFDVIRVKSVNGTMQLAQHMNAVPSSSSVAVLRADGTVTQPAGCKSVKIVGIGNTSGSGSGARGDRSAGQVVQGGAPSGGAPTSVMEYPAFADGKVFTASFGTLGVGGAAVDTDNTAGKPGTLSSAITVGSIFRVNPGSIGLGGVIGTATVAGPTTSTGDFNGAGGPGPSSTGVSGGTPSTIARCPAGGPGGGINSSGAVSNGGPGGVAQSTALSQAAGGTGDGGAGVDGATAANAADGSSTLPGSGGSGGASGDANPGGQGGLGGLHGAGNGGGGAHRGGKLSGKGRDGQRGVLLFIFTT